MPLLPTQPIRVLVVDDHPLLREGIASVLQAQPDMVLAGEAASGAEAIDRYDALRPDVTLMDLQMPGIDGVAATLQIRARHSDARVVMLTTYGGDALALRALKAGAQGYLLKGTIRTELVDVIRAVHSGRRSIPRDVAALLAAHITDEPLSIRELEVLALVAQGNSNRRAAAHLGVSEDTVKAHMKSLMSKLGANDRTHAVTIAIRRGIIQM